MHEGEGSQAPADHAKPRAVTRFVLRVLQAIPGPDSRSRHGSTPTFLQTPGETGFPTFMPGDGLKRAEVFSFDHLYMSA